MYIPLVRERVRVKCRSGEFLVLRADYVRQVADLAAVGDSHAVSADVPFAWIFALFEDAAAEEMAAASRQQPEIPEKAKVRARG